MRPMFEVFANVRAFGMPGCKTHWPLDDPANAQRTEYEIMQTFHRSRDDIRTRVDALRAELKAGLPS